MKATEQLKGEHEEIKLMLKILDKICDLVEAGKVINTEHIDQILEFIEIFVDGCHHSKEEELLFPAIEETGIPREGGPTGVMLMEHNTGRGYAKGMSEAAKRYRAGGSGALHKFVENTRNYALLLVTHIEKENDILYTIADMHLSTEKQEELAEEFEILEREKIGAGKHEELHKLLNNLKKVYLEQTMF